ncbi:Uncharacterised protein [Bordetella pertussis]|nr:Uncharacterised protein [Bordetella pertussis]CFO78747.1 Uncharacterised protein [Bordetella pertussis]CFT98486.1 Uncharacterised protein [Bordetella pertussis]CFU85840.1 Uncharacterised protein [Bordetella pertussis]CFW01555.1 Uncharacterised protein [Bordetella pertussis]
MNCTLASFLTCGASEGFMRSRMSSPPARRLDRRTVVSGMGRNTSLSKW